ncbi:MAG: hypothetical protein ACRYFZ_05385 [Janthinobacterium lividum]
MLPTRHYFANAVGVVDYLPGHYAYLHWSGAPLGSLELRALYIHTRNLLQRESLCCILADHRAMPTAPTAADQQWLLHTWLPQTIADTGYSHCAVLPAPDPAHRLHTPPVVAELQQQHLVVTLFEDLEYADTWLQQELVHLPKP